MTARRKKRTPTERLELGRQASNETDDAVAGREGLAASTVAKMRQEYERSQRASESDRTASATNTMDTAATEAVALESSAESPPTPEETQKRELFESHMVRLLSGDCLTDAELDATMYASAMRVGTLLRMAHLATSLQPGVRDGDALIPMDDVIHKLNTVHEILTSDDGEFLQAPCQCDMVPRNACPQHSELEQASWDSALQFVTEWMIWHGRVLNYAAWFELSFQWRDAAAHYRSHLANRQKAQNCIAKLNHLWADEDD